MMTRKLRTPRSIEIAQRWLQRAVKQGRSLRELSMSMRKPDGSPYPSGALRYALDPTWAPMTQTLTALEDLMERERVKVDKAQLSVATISGDGDARRPVSAAGPGDG